LNLNSTVSQEFDSSNSASKAFDSSNSATAQIFDGSNTLTSYRLDLDNNAVGSGTVSSISTYSSAANTITVQHTTENFVGKGVGTPLYYNVSSAGGYFATNPRGVVFLKSLVTATTNGSVFQISSVPNGTVIPITNALTGTFQLANEARLFAGNNIDGVTETSVTIVNDTAKTFNGENAGGQFLNNCSFSAGNVSGASGSGIADLTLYTGLMVKYETTGTPPTINSGGDATNGGSTTSLVNGRTYFIDSNFQVGSSINYVVTIKEYPTSSSNINFTSTGTGVHKFTAIGIAVDKDIFHIKDNLYAVNDMLRYSYPSGGHFGVNDAGTELKDYYFVQTLYGQHNFSVNWTVGELSPKTQSFIGLTATQSSVTTLMNAQGFGAGLTFSVTSGTLPAGLTLNTTTGVITGTPSNFSGYAQATIRITATDSFGSTDFVDITFQVNQAPFLYSFTAATFTSGGYTGIDGPPIAAARSAIGQSWTSSYLNMNTNGIQLWTVPQTATYRIDCYGAEGGWSSYYATPRGGYGARMQGDFALTQGDVLQIVVGQSGCRNCSHSQGGRQGGGGGATHVIKADNSVLIIAAGGGGSATTPWDTNTSGDAGQSGTSGTNGGCCRAGSGGYGSSSYANGEVACGGAGWYSNGSYGSGSGGSTGAKRFLEGSRGGEMAYSWGNTGTVGGFGGGGGGGLASGGGGGWSGGGRGEWSSPQRGGGGGSINNGANQYNSGGWQINDGQVIITKL
jgi:hypothetical protein